MNLIDNIHNKLKNIDFIKSTEYFKSKNNNHYFLINPKEFNNTCPNFIVVVNNHGITITDRSNTYNLFNDLTKHRFFSVINFFMLNRDYNVQFDTIKKQTYINTTIENLEKDLHNYENYLNYADNKNY